jgi:rhodanese-related sulfurtransferase
MTRTISPAEARRRIEAGALLVDIRQPGEHARESIPGARNVPLSRLERIEGAKEVIFHCRSGMRTSANAGRLAASTDAQAFLLDGGIDAWRRAGYECTRAAPGLSALVRKALVIAVLVLLGSALASLFANPA